MNESTKNNQSINNKHVQLTLNFMLISIMLTCFAIVIEKTIQTFYPIWGSYWFPIFALLITPISLLIRRNQQNAPSTFENQALFVLSEIILIVLITKAISMFSMYFFGISTVWQEITSWSQDFLLTFFNMDFLIRAVAIMLIWLLTWFFSFPLNQLEEDEALMEQEKLVLIFTDRYKARRKLIGLIFNLGILMILSMMLLSSNRLSFIEDPPATGFILGVILVYFFIGFVFLAINQYAIMKARWYFSNIDIGPHLATRWLFFSFIFLLFVSIIIIFLPTNLPLGISSVAQWLSEAFFYIISILFNILTFPIFLIIALITRLFGGETIDQTFTPAEPAPEIIPQIIGTTPWFDVVRSILFWLTFMVVVFTAVFYYINNKPSFNQFLRSLGIFSLIRELWRLIKRGFKETQSAASETIQTGIHKFQSFLKNQRSKLRLSTRLIKQLPPRKAVIKIYTDWVQWNQKKGITRKISQTPYEYAQSYAHNNPEIADLVDPINALTDIFVQARYSRRPVVETQALKAQEITNQLKKSLAHKRDLLSSKER